MFSAYGYKTFIVFVTCLLTFLFLTNNTFAQSAQSVQGAATLGVAQIIQTKDKNVQDGAVLSAGEKGAILTNVPYDSQVVGVVSRDAAVLLNTSQGSNLVPVISNGEVYILVSTKDGVIKKGDLLTSSTMPGIAVKAVNAGYVLGTAMEDYTNPNPKKTDKIAVNLNLHYFNSKPLFPGSLSDILKFVLLPTNEGPSAIFKYVISAIVVLGSFVLSFLSFGRTAAKGVEALGRNPAASKIIHLGIIFNVTIVFVIILAGMTVAFLILRL
jgi:F0F1-type ATP synthase membrane subunit c/vacuolar-type H+-ATPase subunit K